MELIKEYKLAYTAKQYNDHIENYIRCFNKFAEEKGEPRYCLDLILRVITVSLETLRIVRSLPHIDFAQCK